MNDKIRAAAAELDLATVQPITIPPPLQRRIVWTAEHAVAGEKFQLLARRLNGAKSKKAIRTILISSAIPGEGKSTVALNLAGTLARNGSRTLLIDADLRAPSLNKTLALNAESGLGDVLAEQISLDAALRRVDPIGLYILPAGDRINNPMPLLEGATFQALLKRCSEVFDWVVIDSPPLNLLADAHCIASHADTILLVVRWRFTPKNALDEALKSLDGLPLMGMIVNAFDDPHDKHYYSYYTSPSPEAAVRPAPLLSAAKDATPDAIVKNS